MYSVYMIHRFISNAILLLTKYDTFICINIGIQPTQIPYVSLTNSKTFDRTQNYELLLVFLEVYSLKFLAKGIHKSLQVFLKHRELCTYIGHHRQSPKISKQNVILIVSRQGYF